MNRRTNSRSGSGWHIATIAIGLIMPRGLHLDGPPQKRSFASGSNIWSSAVRRSRKPLCPTIGSHGPRWPAIRGCSLAATSLSTWIELSFLKGTTNLERLHPADFYLELPEFYAAVRGLAA